MIEKAVQKVSHKLIDKPVKNYLRKISRKNSRKLGSKNCWKCGPKNGIEKIIKKVKNMDKSFNLSIRHFNFNV